MSKYTTELRFICETYAGCDESQPQTSVNQIIATAAPLIFEDFPLFDPDYRLALECKILKHYYTQEIGFETVGLWKLKLNTKLQEIMPYYNDLYYSASLKYNPLHNIDLTKDFLRDEDLNRNVGETHKENLTGNVTQNTDTDIDSTASSKQTTDQTTVTKQIENLLMRRADTPQGDVQTGLPIFTGYLSEAQQDDKTSDNNTTLTQTHNVNDSANSSQIQNFRGETVENKSLNRDMNEGVDTTEKYLEHLKGKAAGENYPAMIQAYRDALINIDMMIIDELQELFMFLW